MAIQLAVITHTNGHWFFYTAENVVDEQGNGTVFEARGLEKRRERVVTYLANPQRSQRFDEIHYIGEIHESDFNKVASVIRQIPIQNHVEDWNCQNYVIDIMNELERLSFLDQSDLQYFRTRACIEEMMNLVYPYAGEDDEEEDNMDDRNKDAEPRHICSAEYIEDSSSEE